MKFVAASDLHGQFPIIPEADVLLIAGDICPVGKPSIQLSWLDVPFRYWLKSLPVKKVIACAGNHDFVFQDWPEYVAKLNLPWTYLQDEEYWWNDVTFYGSPWQKRFYDWAFNLDEPDLALKWQQIPPKTDILVCHSPPYGFGDITRDGHAGSPSLLERIQIVRPQLTVYGHIHPGYGRYEYDGLTLANVAVVNSKYELVNEPMVFNVEPKPKNSDQK